MSVSGHVQMSKRAHIQTCMCKEEGWLWVNGGKFTDFYLHSNLGNEGLQVTEAYYRKANQDSNISVLFCSSVGVMSP